MTAQAKVGALYNLVHKKTNLLGQIKVMGERLQERIAAYEDGQEIDGILDDIKVRGDKIQEIQVIDKQIAFLEDSGYQASQEEARLIQLEQATILSLAGLVIQLNDKLAQEIKNIQAGLMDSLKEIREGQRSIQAYFPMPEEEEGRQVDTLR